MDTELTFSCMHCNEPIDAEPELAGQEANCPGCSKIIIVPKVEVKGNDNQELLNRYPDLKNRSEKELESSMGFLNEYFKIYCEINPNEDQQMRVVSIAFKEGVGQAMVKRYDHATFADSMQGLQQDSKKINDTLFSNKKLNKELDKILSVSGIKVKKKGLFGLFG